MLWVTVPACPTVTVLACMVCCDPAISSCFKLRQLIFLSSSAVKQLQGVRPMVEDAKRRESSRSDSGGRMSRWLPQGPMAPWGMGLCRGDSWMQSNLAILAMTRPTRSIRIELSGSPCCRYGGCGHGVAHWPEGSVEHRSFQYLPRAEEPLLSNTCRLKGAPPAF